MLYFGASSRMGWLTVEVDGEDSFRPFSELLLNLGWVNVEGLWVYVYKHRSCPALSCSLGSSDEGEGSSYYFIARFYITGEESQLQSFGA